MSDNIGNIWFAGTNGNNILQFDTNGDFLQNFTPQGLNQPLGIAINGSNEIWTINNGNNSLSKIEFFNGSNGSGSPYTNLGLNQAVVTAIDGANQLLIPNCRVGCPGSGSTAPDGVIRSTNRVFPTTVAAVLPQPSPSPARMVPVEQLSMVQVTSGCRTVSLEPSPGPLASRHRRFSPSQQPRATAGSTASVTNGNIVTSGPDVDLSHPARFFCFLLSPSSSFEARCVGRLWLYRGGSSGGRWGGRGGRRWGVPGFG